MSFGICAVKFIDDKPHYLLIQRRDSLGYVEFMRGKYKLDNPDYILLLLNGMTAEERQRLLDHKFDELWENLWNSQNTRQYRNEYEIAKRQFETLSTTGDSKGKSLQSYFAQVTSTWTTPEWGFPKGRRSLHETELNCAIREFTEETGLAKTALHVCSGLDPYVEQYIGTNGITYKQVYYVATCKPSVDAAVQTGNKVMVREVGNIGWFPYEDALAKIRTTNPEKRTVLMKIHTELSSPAGKERAIAALEWVPVKYTQ
jgi:8-oxo-dGTP pyrophosphatase MutT (NUDIX family)